MSVPSSFLSRSETNTACVHENNHRLSTANDRHNMPDRTARGFSFDEGPATLRRPFIRLWITFPRYASCAGSVGFRSEYQAQAASAPRPSSATTIATTGPTKGIALKRM